MCSGINMMGNTGFYSSMPHRAYVYTHVPFIPKSFVFSIVTAPLFEEVGFLL